MNQVQQVQEADLPNVADLNYEAFAPYGTTENPKTFSFRFKAFPSGFIALTEGDEIVAYG